MDTTLRFLRRSWDTVTLTLALALCLAASVPLSRTAAWIPRIILTITLALVIVQLAREARELSAIARSESRRDSSTAPSDLGRDDAATNTAAPGLIPTRTTSAFAAVLWICGLLLSVLVFGAAAGSMLYALAYLRGHARASWLSGAIFAFALGACLQLAFASVLHIELYRGWLWHTLQQ